MRRAPYPFSALAAFPVVVALVLLSHPAAVPVVNADDSRLLETIVSSFPAPLPAEVADPARQVAIRWIRIAPDKSAPGGLRLDRHVLGNESPPYFYPASTVKLPTALVALEKLARLRRERSLPGLTIDATMRTGAAEPWQTEVDSDPSAPGGVPTLGHYLRKVFLVSDNDAHNRLYEFAGPDEIAASLEAKGYEGIRILHRLSVGDDWQRGRHTNPVTFLDGDRVLLELPAQVSVADRRAGEPILRGKGFMRAGELVVEPMDFSANNALPLEAMQEMLAALAFPDTVDPSRQWAIDPGDRAAVLRAMGTYPAEAGSPQYGRDDFPDGYAKFLVCGGRDRAPDGVRVFNKSGLAYGFVTDNALVCDFETGVAFFLAATIHVNDDGVYNDNQYRYEDVAFPFMRALGEAVLAHERVHGTPLGGTIDAFRRLGE